MLVLEALVVLGSAILAGATSLFEVVGVELVVAALALPMPVAL